MVRGKKGRPSAVKKRFIVILLSFSCALSCASPVYAAKSLNEVNKQKQKAESDRNKAQDELEEVTDDIDELSKNKEALEEEIHQIDDELVDLILSVDILNQDMENKSTEITDAQDEYDAAKAKESELQQAMKLRIKFMYEKGNQSYMDTVLQSKNMAELVNKSEYAERLYAYDRQLLDEYQDAKEEMLSKKTALEGELSEMEEMQEDYLNKEVELNAMIAVKKAEVEDFDSQLEAAKSKANKYKERINKQNETIREYELEASKIKDEQERKKAEEELRKKLKAEEEKIKAKEAKEKAEEAARLAAQKEAEEADASEDDEDLKDPVDTKPEEKTESTEAPKEEQKDANDDKTENEDINAVVIVDESTSAQTEKEVTPEPSPEVSSDPGNASLGQEIANYACQFVGNPYVAGGTSLTEGCDCSGFTSSVYAHFGIKIPRNSYSQSTAGRAVDVSAMQPGDVIYYGGHVAIYIGNGSIVHASTAATGIKISSVYYRSIITVRRFV